MSERGPLTLLALESFKPGDVGWLTPQGVVCSRDHKAPAGTMCVVALQRVEAYRLGLFREVFDAAP